jgi:AcrR family transcriptional regulator
MNFWLILERRDYQGQQDYEQERKTMKKRQSGRRANSRRTILHAARVLFERKGIEHVTFNDIALESGLSRTTIFNHFPAITDLLYALINEEVSALEEMHRTGGKTGAAAIDAMFTKLLEDTVKYPVLAWKLLSYTAIRQDEKSLLGRLEAIIWENLPELPDERKHDRVVMITGVYYGLVNHCFINRKEFDAGQMHEEFLRLAAPYIN